MMKEVRWRVFCVFSLLVLQSAGAQVKKSDEKVYVKRQTFSVFGEYSNDSSHMLLGRAENRKLLSVGGSYAYRMWSTRYNTLQYLAEIRPMMFTSDPMETDSVSFNPSAANSGITVAAGGPVPASERCVSGIYTYQYMDPISGQVYTYTDTVTCSRRWTFAQGMSPVGFKVNLLPHRRVQPVISGLAGYMFSTKPVPTNGAGSLNFTFEFGGGIEVFRGHGRSMLVEYRYHHYSNKDSADENPGVDNGIFKLTYSFGR